MDGGEPCSGRLVKRTEVRIRYLPREHRASADALGADTLAASVYWATYTLHPDCADIVGEYLGEHAPGRSEVLGRARR